MAARDTFNMTTIGGPNNNNTTNQTSYSLQAHSPWHSPVPYLFGGLAAMLGLIAFALLILACSYWKLSGYLENNNGESSQERDLEAGEGKPEDGDKKKLQPLMQEKFLVIMAGQLKPTYLATQVSSSASTSRSSSFGDSNKSCTCSQEDDGKMEEEEEEGCDDQVRSKGTGSQDGSSNQSH